MSLVAYDSSTTSSSDTDDEYFGVLHKEDHDDHDADDDADDDADGPYRLKSTNTATATDNSNSNSSNAKPTLPSASQLLGATSNRQKKTSEIFGNPFREAENAKTALLEKHVKMVIGKEDQLTRKNGRKICWNNRKGRCKFGSNCQYAHDSDLISDPAQELDAIPSDPHSEDKGCASHTSLLVEVSSKSIVNQKSAEAAAAAAAAKKRKRPGLSDSLHPSKRVLKAYMQQTQLARK